MTGPELCLATVALGVSVLVQAPSSTCLVEKLSKGVIPSILGLIGWSAASEIVGLDSPPRLP